MDKMAALESDSQSEANVASRRTNPEPQHRGGGRRWMRRSEGIDSGDDCEYLSSRAAKSERTDTSIVEAKNAHSKVQSLIKNEEVVYDASGEEEDSLSEDSEDENDGEDQTASDEDDGLQQVTPRVEHPDVHCKIPALNHHRINHAAEIDRSNTHVPPSPSPAFLLTPPATSKAQTSSTSLKRGREYIEEDVGNERKRLRKGEYQSRPTQSKVLSSPTEKKGTGCGLPSQALITPPLKSSLDTPSLASASENGVSSQIISLLENSVIKPSTPARNAELHVLGELIERDSKQSGFIVQRIVFEDKLLLKYPNGQVYVVVKEEKFGPLIFNSKYKIDEKDFEKLMKWGSAMADKYFEDKDKAQGRGWWGKTWKTVCWAVPGVAGVVVFCLKKEVREGIVWVYHAWQNCELQVLQQRMLGA